MRVGRRHAVVLGFVGIITVLASWQLLAIFLNSPFFPSVRVISVTFVETWTWSRIVEDLFPSLRRLILGFGLGAIVAICSGLIVGYVDILRRAVEPLVEFLRSIPPITLVPALVLAFGIGDLSKVLVIALGTFFIVFLNTVEGVRSMDSVLSDMARAYRLTIVQRLRMRLAWALPQIMAGGRVAIAIALVLMVTSEMFASTEGLGYFVIDAQKSFAIPQMWAGIVTLGLLGYALNLAFVSAEKRLTHWHRNLRSSAAEP